MMEWQLGPNDIIALMPYVSLVVGAFVVLLYSFLGSTEKRIGYAVISSIAAIVSFYFLYLNRELQFLAWSEILVHDFSSYAFSAVILLLLIPATWVHACSSSIGDRPSGICSLLLLSACGGVLMAHSNHLLMFFVALELMSLPLYVITAIGNDPKASEAGFKYFLLGSISSAIFIYGVALTWSGFNTLWISDIAQILVADFGHDLSGSQWAGFALMFVGLFFKLGVFPFHLWIVDVYQAAPSHLVAWMSGAVKAATFALAIRLMSLLPSEYHARWIAVLTMFAVISMFVGSIGGLFQQNLKRLLGYSTVAHGGYACIALIAVLFSSAFEASKILSFYLLVYGFSSMAAFTVCAILEENHIGLDSGNLKGLSRKSPAVAIVFSIALLSLAGVPPFGGFFAKFQLFMFSLSKGLLFVTLMAVLSSVIALGYYLSLLVNMFFQDGGASRLSTAGVNRFVLGLAWVLIVLLGVIPGSISYLVWG
ncbi:MAG: NADH-quinone oxidoreductase subunit N [Bdellovibrionota bacterium]